MLGTIVPLLILPLLFLAFRSWWLVAVGAIPSALAILVVLAMYALSGTTLPAALDAVAAEMSRGARLADAIEAGKVRQLIKGRTIPAHANVRAAS